MALHKGVTKTQKKVDRGQQALLNAPGVLEKKMAGARKRRMERKGLVRGGRRESWGSRRRGD